MELQYLACSGLPTVSHKKNSVLFPYIIILLPTKLIGQDNLVITTKLKMKVKSDHRS